VQHEAFQSQLLAGIQQMEAPLSDFKIRKIQETVRKSSKAPERRSAHSGLRGIYFVNSGYAAGP
jgi:hypothetical protein